METGPNSLNEEPLLNSAAEEQKVNKGRRNFLVGIGAGLIAGLSAPLVIESISQTELNNLKDYYEGKEEDFFKVHEAVAALSYEMRVNNVRSINFNKLEKLEKGSRYNERMIFYRDFLKRHLISNTGKKHQSRDVILSQGYFDDSVLNYLSESCKYITGLQNYNNTPTTNQNHSSKKLKM